MATFGSFSLLVALALAVYNLFAGTLALWLLASGRPARVAPERLASTARRAGIAGFFAVSASALVLVWAAFTNNFSIAYVLEHSNRALPLAYKFAALWSGQEGSLLLWAWLLGAYTALLRLRHRTSPQLYAYAGTILAAIQVFFLAVLNFAVRPFALTLGPLPDDGFGLNPLLQYWEMVIHPPLLYLGYVGFAIPFAFALAALLMRSADPAWLRIVRTWTLVTWLFLTAGIFLGMHWAYAVLGWGGYWGWDPVENSSFMPWLTGTAFLHSVIMQEKKGMMKGWNLWLIFSTFLLTLLGTMLTRAGVVSSVHAFAKSSIGNWFVAFMGIVFVVCLFAYLSRRSLLKPDHAFQSLLSRESSFLFNNLVLLAACLVIFWGTLFPVFSEYLRGSKITVGPAFYNSFVVPIGLFLLFLAGIAPLLPWRSASLRSLRHNFLLPCLALWITVALCLLCGLRIHERGGFYALVAFALAAAVLTAIAGEFLRGAHLIARQTGSNFFAALWILARRNTRRYGGYIVHIGVLLTFVGLAGAAFNQTVEKELSLHDQMQLGPYTLQCTGFTQDANDNYQTEYALLDVSRNGKFQFQLAPELRIYLASQQPQSMVAIHSALFWDLYAVYEGVNPDTGHPILKAYLNPLVGWLWSGLLIMVLGTLLALLPNVKPAPAAALPPAKEPAHE